MDCLYTSHTYSYSSWLGCVLGRNCCVIPALISIEMFSDNRNLLEPAPPSEYQGGFSVHTCLGDGSFCDLESVCERPSWAAESQLSGSCGKPSCTSQPPSHQSENPETALGSRLGPNSRGS